MDEFLFSECCGALPNNVVDEYDDEITGECSECKELATFSKDEDLIDWQDELEYIMNHRIGE
ncbi:MAG: hypothetical protein HOI55_00040 [Candidatus Marinimicrobia bacterium]|jgi:hypothetical protein|nr:hypothetical protein [Candidatus Neomarinimicrobiota bacterium]